MYKYNKISLFLQANSVLNNLASGYDNVSCMIWEGRDVKKVDLSVLDIGWTIIQKVCPKCILAQLFLLKDSFKLENYINLCVLHI